MSRLLLVFVLAFGIFSASAQTTYLQLNQEDYHLFDRLETKSGAFSNVIFTTVKPLGRKNVVRFLEDAKYAEPSYGLNLSSIDRYNIDHAISVSGEWGTMGDAALDTRRPWFNTFYKKQPDFFRVNKPDFFLSVNPVISAIGFSENNNGTNSTGFASSRGIELRGHVAKKVGFYLYATDNQEQPVSFVNTWIKKHDAVPGADYYQTPNNNTFDYLQSRGYIDFAAVKDHVNVTFGYDRHFIGDGIRSLFLSDFSAGATFLRLNTKIWRLNYQNLYLELTPQYHRGGDRRLTRKYATIHHLSVNATHWLNIGLFEGIVFSRPDRYEFSYLVPVIFYRQIERALGSPDNALLGLNFKALALRHVQLYGQFMLDELKFKELTAKNGWWGNKFGVQLGAKYYDAFGIPNLDLQLEYNQVRPFTYSHSDTFANYTHYNQPLAHPLGAGFKEILGVARYQPIRKLYLSLKGMYYEAGVDTGNVNFGNDIFQMNSTRSGEYGYAAISGVKSTAALLNFSASYELLENLFIDLGVTHRQRKYEVAYPTEKTTYYTAGLRLNIAKRDYDFY